MPTSTVFIELMLKMKSEIECESNFFHFLKLQLISNRRQDIMMNFIKVIVELNVLYQQLFVKNACFKRKKKLGAIKY